jgi:nucleotide-binding universal stress UspA family protein
MRVVVWINELGWEGCVDQARELIPPGAQISLLHVSPRDVEELAVVGRERLLGRRPKPQPGPPLREIAAEEALALLERARTRLGRPAELDARSGRVEREVVKACAGADLLVLVRDGKPRLGPPSFGPRTRFVVDHAPCRVLVVWAQEPPGIETIPVPKHERHE